MLVGTRVAALAAGAGLFFTSSAFAHVSVNSPAFVGGSAVLTFSVGHGCEGADTVKIEVTLPEEVTAVRGLPSSFGDPELVKDDTDIVKKVVWTKANARAADDFYYQLPIRITVPDAPFKTLYFPAKQTCRGADNKETVVDWAALPTPGETTSGEEGPPPAPAVTILPARKPGWNKFTVPAAISDLKIFDDAEIVWAGDAAYSGNTATAEQIAAEDGVETLSEIKANTEIWVKY